VVRWLGVTALGTMLGVGLLGGRRAWWNGYLESSRFYGSNSGVSSEGIQQAVVFWRYLKWSIYVGRSILLKFAWLCGMLWVSVACFIGGGGAWHGKYICMCVKGVYMCRRILSIPKTRSIERDAFGSLFAFIYK